MRLNSIKLAGFKSFAEPTHFQLPGQLVGVVGPNGCGKSNIMDAVRWVLGESRAGELRGQNMQDVIFGGTTQRKPASRASVELSFDNSDRRAGGQWGRYDEIAVRRVLTRDGVSSYYINNQPVRRRDVQDVFLGTGLGPRAYAIIGQGTISRIIESRPEELRLFLEEAAGVSKYKERRRETESRLADTRDNLTRVQDVLRELQVQLNKLEKQAEVAAKYQALQRQASLCQHQLWFLKHVQAQAQQADARAQGLQATNTLDSHMADLRRVETELEVLRQSHGAAGEQLNQAQGHLYAATAEVGKLDAEIRYVAQSRQRVEQRLAQLSSDMEQWVARRDEARGHIQNLEGEDEQAQEQAQGLAARLQELMMQLPELHEALQQSQQQSQQQRDTMVQLQQQVQVLAAEQRSLDEQSQQLHARCERLRMGRNALAAPDEAHLARLHQLLAQAQQEAAQAEARLTQWHSSLPQLEEARRQCQQTANEENARQVDVSARLQTLCALQEKLKVNAQLVPWLARHGLDGLAALWSQIHVEPGWESALEAALRERLHALPMEPLELADGFAAATDVPPARLAFYSLCAAALPHNRSAADADKTALGLPPLLGLLRVHDAGLYAVLKGWLHGCHSAAALQQALACRAQLQPGEVIYVASGHAVDAHGVRFYARDSEQSGVLARAQEIAHLEKQHRAQSLIAQEAANAFQRAEAAYAQGVGNLESARKQASESQSHAHALQVQSLHHAQEVQQIRERCAQMDADLAEAQAQLEVLQERRSLCEARFEELDWQLAENQERDIRWSEQLSQAQRHMDECRQQQRTLERQEQEAQFTCRSLQARRAELVRALETALGQISHLQQEQQNAQHEQARLGSTTAHSGLQQALQAKAECEAALAALRSQYDDLGARLRSGQEQRMQHEQALEPLRQSITELQLKEQAARLGCEQYSTLLEDAGADLAAVAHSIETDKVRADGLQAEMERLQREAKALGAVNLAALDELTLARERHGFLNAQNEDLQQAMRVLQGAIEKIDAQTRALLVGTFDAVNEHFGRMFPELFGGGQARLIMTGDEILNAGVQVMAQPPGKKNQTIHLLSGGEKALTAIALVFAIFQLNPAPFCLLDEVDAPLDDANTERYAKLVASMSGSTQFLFISHNKIAMEMAGQLIGVTMQEQGVSRIVAVDMESAVHMADAAHVADAAYAPQSESISFP